MDSLKQIFPRASAGGHATTQERGGAITSTNDNKRTNKLEMSSSTRGPEARPTRHRHLP